MIGASGLLLKRKKVPTYSANAVTLIRFLTNYFK